MTDVLLFHEFDGGNIVVADGAAELTHDLRTAVYLSWFGGNERDSGLEDGDRLQWWANLSEPVAERRYRSELQHMLRSLPAVPANLKRLEGAAERDLAWLVDAGLATLVLVKASMPAVDRVRLDARVDVDGESVTFPTVRHWGVSLAGGDSEGGFDLDFSNPDNSAHLQTIGTQ